MTNREFCYWLQGFFELSSPSVESLSASQAICIKNHLKLVEAKEKFCEFLENILELSEFFTFDSRVVSLIMAKLNDEFEHVLDAPNPELNVIHHGKP